ncbi:pre-rRNA-processing protein [Starmerella bacillaris]|uniref:Pre-rRNA-processing protein n=1 Tax=Starmerella bacillaris TaxID=1247836 RepID=A0AAV5RHI2_STABA|nr:pre-rRNA-processing protein [Starmerella bacillaris]
MAGKKVKDSRFAAIETDPRFKLPRKKNIRGDVDSRFKTALETDSRFTEGANIDKYGRQIESKDIKKQLERYYNFKDDEDEQILEEQDVESTDDSFKSANEDIPAPAVEEDEETNDTKKKVTKKPDMRMLMRGEGEVSSSEESDSDSDSDSDSEPEIVMEDEYEEVRQSNANIPKGDISKRFAVVNLDWDNITSTDLMSAFSSFVPPNGRVLSVQIYPSEYGKKQMQEEETQGPASHLFSADDSQKKGDASSQKSSKNKSKSRSNEETELDDDRDYSSSKLRKYQLQRLQYYYAVVTCDSELSASKIYDQCDGTEYESTANFFDLRYIPDEVDFSEDKPRDECFKLPSSYQPTNFTTDALQHSKVKLTWDETPKERHRITQKAFAQSASKNDDDIDGDIKAYLASDSDSDDGEDIAAKYRALLANNTDAAEESDGGVDITFNPVLEGKEATLEIIEDDNANSKGNENPAEDDNLTTIERYRLKEKQRRIRRMENYKARKAAEEQDTKPEVSKAELELLTMDDNLEGGSVSTSISEDVVGKNGKKKMTRRATKKKLQEQAEQDFNTEDPRFSALYEDPDFAIDSTLPQFKKTKGMEKIIKERRRRQNNSEPRAKRSRQAEPEPENWKQLAAKLRRKNASQK